MSFSQHSKSIAQLAVAAVSCLFIAAEPPHLEFVEKLRTGGLADLALEYLDRLEKNGPAELKPFLPLERAKTNAELAEQQEDEKKRDQILDDARAAFEKVLASKPGVELTADASFELARVIVRQGRNRMTAARRAEDKAERKDGLAQARQILETAGRALSSAEKALNQQISQTSDEETKSRLEQRKLAMQYEGAVVAVNRALTLSTSDPKTRNNEIESARRRFQRIADLDPNDSTSWLAYAWVGRCWMELENTIQAKKIFDTIEKETSRPAAAGAVRAARYYQLQLIDSDPQAKVRAGEIVRGGEDWLSRYAGFSKSPEGQGVQFILATTLISQAQTGVTPSKEKGGLPTVSPNAKAQLSKAEKHLKELTRIDGEYTRKAGSLRSEILFLLMADRAITNVNRLMSFEECYLTAQVESYRSSKAENEGGRRRHVQKAIDSLERGLQLSNRSDLPRELFDARIMLCYLYLLNNDPYSAAVLSEYMAHSLAPSPKGAKAAVYGLSAHATILAQNKARKAAPEELAADEQRLRDLAQFMEKHWTNEPDTDAARFQLGMLFYDARDYVSAVDLFSKVKPTFQAFAFAKLREGAAAQIAQGKDIQLSDEKKKKLLTTALNDLNKVSDPAAGFSNETILAHFQARLQLATLLLIEAQQDSNYQRVQQIGEQLIKLLPDLIHKDDPLYPQLQIEAERIRTAGITGRAYLQIKAADYETARTTMKPLLENITKSADDWKKSAHAQSEWFQVFIQSQREVLLLNLKADFLEAKTDDAKATMAALRTLSRDNQSDQLFNSLLRVVYELKLDLERFKQAKQTVQQKKLEGSLIQLIDSLAQTKALSIEARLVLGQAFGAVDRHDKAAELLNAVPAPLGNDEATVRTYRFVRLSLARELRQAKKFTEAKMVLREILGTPAKKGWGFDNFDARKEAVQLLEDEGDYGNAVKMATEMQKVLIEPARQHVSVSQQLRDAKEKQLQTDATDKLDQQLQQLTPQREKFFEFYFLEIRAIIKSSHKSDATKANDTINRIANRLVKLEQSQPDMGGEASRERFRELLSTEPQLKEKYESAGGKVLRDSPMK